MWYEVSVSVWCRLLLGAVKLDICNSPGTDKCDFRFKGDFKTSSGLLFVVSIKP